MSTSYTEQEHEARRAHRDDEARNYPRDTSARSIGQLVADATQDISTIVRNEIQLAKAEVTADVSKAGKGAAFFAVAGVLALFGLAMLLHAIAWAIAALGLPVWVGYLIVAVLLFAVCGVLAMMGKKAIANAKFKPERTIRNAQETVEAIKPAKPTATGSATNTSAYSSTTDRSYTSTSSARSTTAGTAYTGSADTTQRLDTTAPGATRVDEAQFSSADSTTTMTRSSATQDERR